MPAKYFVTLPRNASSRDYPVISADDSISRDTLNAGFGRAE